MKYWMIGWCLIVTACVTQEKCMEKFPPQQDTVYSHTVIYQDSTIYVQISGDTVVRTVYIPVEVETPEICPVTASTELAWARAELTNHRLQLQLIQRNSVLEFKLDSVKRFSMDTVFITSAQVVTEVVEKRVGQLYLYGFYIVLALMLFTLVLLILKK